MAVSVSDVSASSDPTIAVLERALQMNQQRYEVLSSYFVGDHPHTFDSTRFRQAFGNQLRQFADNWMRLVINATVNRLTVQGFRVGADDFGTTDDTAWRIWKASRLGQASTMAHREALKLGTCFLLVDPTVPGLPRITVESPLQVIGQRSAENRYELINAIKKWIGDDGWLRMNFYTPDYVFKYQAPGPAQSSQPLDPSRVEQQADFELIDEVENPLGVVPIVPMENNPDLLYGGMSDLDDLIPLNDALNKELRDMLVASEYQAFKQRWITGVDIPKDPETGKPLTSTMAQLTASERNVWMFPPTDRGEEPIKVGEFTQIDLMQFTTAIDMLIHHISMVSNTPSYMLVGRMANLPLAVDTVVPTPSGQTTMGALKAGDTVYAPDGSEQKVLDALPIRYGRECYRMTFDDGTEIVADAEHKWETSHFKDPAIPYSRRKRFDPRETSIVTTAQIAASVKTSLGTNNHFIPVAEPHEGPELLHPIDPYALGAWLGDGSRGAALVTSHVSDSEALADRLRTVGETVSVRSYPASDELHRDTRTLSLTSDKEKCLRGHTRARGTKTDSARCPTCAHLGFRRRYHGEPMPKPTNVAFVRRLRDLGVLGNKHIPERYFHGSIDQRLGLLQGIMDTDGTVNREQGSVAITLHDQRLASDVHRLAQSLGHKVRLRREQWRSRGKGLVSARTGECWRMSWMPPQIVFRMGRKAELQRLPVQGGDGKSSLPFRRYIVACDPTGSVPVRCINVSHPSRLFCVTDAFVATHNSADAIRAAELGFVGKLLTKQADFGVAWERAMAMALRTTDDIETIWASAAANSGSILSNELSQMVAMGMPIQIAYERYGATPQEVEYWIRMKRAEVAEGIGPAPDLVQGIIPPPSPAGRGPADG